MLKKINLDKLIIFLIYFYPLFLIIGPAANNIFHIIILLFSGYIFFDKKINLLVNQKIIIYSLLFLFLYSIVITIFNENYLFLKNSIFFLKLISFILVLSFFVQNNIFEIKKFIIINFCILSVVIIDTIFQYKTGYNIMGYEIEPINKIRLTSFFKGEYVVGSFISKIFLPIIICVYFYFKNKKYRNVLFLLFLNLTVLTVFITGERSSLLITLFSLFLSFLFINEIRKIFFYNFFIIIILISLIFTSSQQLRDRYFHETFAVTLKLSNTQSDKNIYNSHYGAIYLSSIEIIKENFWFGKGLRAYRIITCNPETRELMIKKIEKKTNHAQMICSTHPHNYILELLIDLGFVGLVIFLFIIYNSLKQIFYLKNLKKKISINKNIIISFGIQFLAMFWPITTHGSIFSSWNSSFIILNFCIFYSLLLLKDKVAAS